MKKILKFSCFYLLVIFITTVGGIQKVNAVPTVCRVNGAQHVEGGQPKLFSHIYWNKQMYNGHLYTCGCGEQVVCFDAYRYFSPNGVKMDHTPGYPVIGQEWYIPTTTYSGSPSTWYNVR